jgi:hypothetical protein
MCDVCIPQTLGAFSSSENDILQLVGHFIWSISNFLASAPDSLAWNFRIIIVIACQGVGRLLTPSRLFHPLGPQEVFAGTLLHVIRNFFFMILEFGFSAFYRHMT